jgi:hypothetical protein
MQRCAAVYSFGLLRKARARLRRKTQGNPHRACSENSRRLAERQQAKSEEKSSICASAIPACGVPAPLLDKGLRKKARTSYDLLLSIDGEVSYFLGVVGCAARLSADDIAEDRFDKAGYDREARAMLLRRRSAAWLRTYEPLRAADAES